MENPVDNLLDKIRLNSVYLTNKHINNHLLAPHTSGPRDVPRVGL